MSQIAMIDTRVKDLIQTLTKDQRSIIVYAESCLVDRGGLLEARKMNKEDFDNLHMYEREGFLSHGRIPFSVMQSLEGRDWSPTHWITFKDKAWELAHALRRFRAEVATSASRQKVDAALAEDHLSPDEVRS